VLPPTITVCELGDPEIVKSGIAAALTVSVTVVVCAKVPLVPVIVSVELPVGVLLLVCIVSVEHPERGGAVRVNVADAPVVKALLAKLTVPAKPPKLPIFTVYVVLPLMITDWFIGEAEIMKSGVEVRRP